MIEVLAASELWDGELRRVVVRDVPVLVVRLGGRVYAYRDVCPHLGAALSEGCLDGAVLTCGAHGWRFDLATGCGVNPASARLRPIAVAVRDGQVLVDVEEAA